jgi:hypothetical protein
MKILIHENSLTRSFWRFPSCFRTLSDLGVTSIHFRALIYFVGLCCHDFGGQAQAATTSPSATICITSRVCKFTHNARNLRLRGGTDDHGVHPTANNTTIPCSPLQASSWINTAASISTSPAEHCSGCHPAASVPPSQPALPAPCPVRGGFPPPPAAPPDGGGSGPWRDARSGIWWLPPERCAGDDGVEALRGAWTFSPRDCIAFRNAAPDEWGHIPAPDGCLGGLERLCEVHSLLILPRVRFSAPRPSMTPLKTIAHDS